MRQDLKRTTFTTSRLLDFASVKELTAQMGHEPSEWPLVVLKELGDNALDAGEEADRPPVVQVEVDETGIVVRDNGPGLPPSVVESILDFSSRTSSREAYVSPTRGAQGNALKTLLAMPFVLDGERGQVEIGAHGVRHTITFRVDRIRQQPVIDHEVVPDADCKIGTEIRVHWPKSACSLLRSATSRFLQIAEDFCWLNPSLTLDATVFGHRLTLAATDPAWKKWKASDPTSPHWYDLERFTRLVAAYVSHDADSDRVRTVREFVSEFRGLSGSARGKAVLSACGLAREPLSCLVVDGGIDPVRAALLLAAMQKESAPVKPALLGSIGREHFKTRLEAAGCVMESFDYKRITDVDDLGIPFVVETAFGWLGDVDVSDHDDIDVESEIIPTRRLVTGVNWSPGIRNPFRMLGSVGASLDTILSQQRVDRDEPVIFVLHVACPRVDYLDRGKSSVVVR